MNPIDAARTALFVPANRPERVDKAVRTHADIVIIDLEDAVPQAEKTKARALVQEKIQLHAGRALMVRINSLDTPLAAEDLSAVFAPGLSAVMVPKVQRPEDVSQIHGLMCDQEARRGIPAGSVGLVSLLESTLAVENAFGISSVVMSPSRPHRIAFGAADFTLDLGAAMTPSGEELNYPRARIAVACRAAGLACPLDSPFMIDLRDLDALRADTLRAKHLGFGGRLCIHPNQVDICNQIYSPTEQEIELAARVVAAYTQAAAEGKGAIEVDGKMIDSPLVAHYRRVLAAAGRLTP